MVPGEAAGAYGRSGVLCRAEQRAVLGEAACAYWGSGVMSSMGTSV